MKHDLNKMLGRKYDELLKDAAFLSVIGGNVPEKTSKEFNTFHIVSSSSYLSFTFDDKQKTLKFITLVADTDGNLACGLTTGMDELSIHNMLGEPIEMQPSKSVPVLGKVGAWEVYIIENCKIMLMYSSKSNCLESIRFII